MFKKIMSVMLAALMLMSVAVMATSAAQVEIADNSAEAIAEVAADAAADTGADGTAETGAAKTFSFDASTTNWKNYKSIYCHIWVYGGESIYAFKAKAEKCTDNGDGTWTYDLDAKGVTLEDGVLYGLLFGNENGMQTYNLLVDTSCYGDTAYCTADEYENPVDSNKKHPAAFWKGQDASKFGPEMCITSIGNVVGTCVPYTTSAQAMFVNFLGPEGNFANAKLTSGKDEQTIIDDTAKALGLQIGNVEQAIKDAGVTVEWDPSKSSLQEGTNEEAEKNPDGEVIKTPEEEKKPGANTDKDTDTDNNKDSDSTGSSGSGSTGSGSSSSTKTSGSTTKTGQETTVLYIMLGVMIAAAAVIVITRKQTKA